MGRYKIQQILITNLKHFKGEFPIVLGGKNLLLYGENGSGKSSIYWALHLFYQSCLKSQDTVGAGKYFDPNNVENLRNAYVAATDKSGVEIVFRMEGTTSDLPFHDTNLQIDTDSAASNKFMRFSLQSSDFVSYKSLASLYDFRNSQICDVTSLFEREIFPTMDLPAKVRDLDGNIGDESNISAWWSAMERYFASLPRRSVNSKVLMVDSGPYIEFDKLLKFLNKLLQNSFLDDINNRANRILRDDFNVPYRVELELKDAKFNQAVRNPGAKRSHRDNSLTAPRILLKMKWMDDQLPTASHEMKVEHPQSFFNEAKLTIATFAIRLAIIEMKYAGTAVNSAPIICFDDLLISLDMGNRVPVAERILKCANDYQLLIFTHDMSLYNLFMSLIPENDRRDKWLCYELYNVLDDINDDNSHNPHLCQSKSYIEKAKYAWQHHDIPAAVNYLRKETERLLQKLMPLNMLLSKNVEKAKLNDWMQRVPEFVRLYSLPANPIVHMDYFRSRLLNPLSHDDFGAPVYSNELKICIEELSELAKYEKGDIIKGNDILSTHFELAMTYGTMSMLVEFVCAENWDYCYERGTTTPRYYKDVKVKVVLSSDTMVVPIKDSVPLNEIYKNVYTHLGYTKNSAPKLEDIVMRLTDGKLLRDI